MGGLAVPANKFALPQQDIEGLYIDHGGWLKGWLRRKLGDACSAADLAHDTFVRLLTKDALPEIREPRALLTTIAHAGTESASAPASGTGLPGGAGAPAGASDAFAGNPGHPARNPVRDRSPARRPAPLDETSFSAIPDRWQAPKRDRSRVGVSVPTVKRYIAKALAHCCFA